MGDRDAKSGVTFRHFTVSESFRAPLKTVLGFVEKNYTCGLHSQAFYEVNIVLRGEALHFVGDATWTVKAGDVFVVPPNVLHAYTGGEGFDVYHLLIHPSYLEKHSAELKLLPAFTKLFRIDPLMRERELMNPHFSLASGELDEILPMLERLSIHSKEESVESAIIAGGEALIVIARLCGIYEENGAPLAGDEDDSAFLASIAYIYENFDKSFTVETLARIAQMSRTAYIERFKRVTGLPPKQFLVQYRISVAKKLLADGVSSQAEVAQAVGCYDASHLARMLKRVR